ncbi:retrovirus-related pol polyprotein from transposon TNT 1-94 [Tanacetum coccineum]
MMKLRHPKAMTKNMLWIFDDPNHLIGDCPNPQRNKDQMAFVGGSRSDSENEAEDKPNDETCLVAQPSNEVCLRICLEPDEWIKDSGCSKHMTGNKNLFSTYKAYNGGNVVFRSDLKGKITNKVEESLNVTFDESSSLTKLSPLVDDDFDEEEAIENNTKVVNNNNVEDESVKVDEIVNIKVSKNHPLEQVIENLNQRTLRSQAQNQSNFFCFISTIEPKNVNEALGDESWVVSMQEELNQFIANDVWDLVPLPKNYTVIGTKWVYRNKLDENCIVSRNKARLVAQGYNQQEAIDYNETYAPVARLESIRILLAIACANEFKLYQMDVKSAFLNGFIMNKGGQKRRRKGIGVYVTQPLGFIDFEKTNYVYKLKKALYGLKQAPKACYDILKAFLLKHVYSMRMVDNTLFTKKFKSHLIIVQIYVDDIIFGSTWSLNKKIEDMIFFNQSKYIKEMLKKFGLEDSRPTKKPMLTEIKLTKDDKANFVDITKYQDPPKGDPSVVLVDLWVTRSGAKI